MAVREYIGARYIPIFATDAEWSSANTYEPLTVVTYEGCSYVSRQYVPAGIDLDNGDYWVLWADFNAQVEAYREEVQAFDGRIDALEDGLPVSDFDENTTVKDAIDGVKALLPASDFASDATVKDAIDGIGALLPTTAFDSTNTVDARFDVIEADSWVTTTRIADDAITADKIADNAIASSNIVSNAITSEKLADSAVTTSKIADNSVTKDKIANDSLVPEGCVVCDNVASGETANTAKDASDALVSLGYSRQDATKAVNAVINDGDDVETVIKAALKKLF